MFHKIIEPGNEMYGHYLIVQDVCLCVCIVLWKNKNMITFEPM